jgi:FlaA1/EpsC-like NDP-sugar epimerase
MLPRPVRAWRRGLLFVLADGLVLAASIAIAWALRFDGRIPAGQLATMSWALLMSVAIKIPVFAAFRVYRFSWAHVGLRELWDTALACAAASAVLTAALFLLRDWPALAGVPRSVLAMDFALTLLGVAGVRLSKRILRQVRSRARGRRRGARTLIVGAGDAGTQLARAIRDEPDAVYFPVGFVDDDPGKQGLSVAGLRVVGPRRRLPSLVERHDASAVILAMPSSSAAVVRETVELARQAGVKEIRIVPSLNQLYSGEVSVAEVREIRVEDLLPREPVAVETAAVAGFLEGRTVLVTGAAGSIGTELCRQLLRIRGTRVFAVDNNETGLFDLAGELRPRLDPSRLEVMPGDVRDRARMARILEETAPSLVYHAAAYKHVPLMESAPVEAVKTNVFGTQIVMEEAQRSGAEGFVLISTDKAVNPTSVMGATKWLAEMLVRAGDAAAATRCVAVRFGNVLGSRGSVIPTFVEQIQRGGPVTVTDPGMRRYFMVTSEAVLLVLQASAMGDGGEVFVLDMGEPVSIDTLARELIRSHGLEPDRDIPIAYTGVRPGEKLLEELLTAEEGVDATAHERVFIARLGQEEKAQELTSHLERLGEACAREAAAEVRRLLRDAVPSYHPEASAG